MQRLFEKLKPREKKLKPFIVKMKKLEIKIESYFKERKLLRNTLLLIFWEECSLNLEG
jgi:hypothetical protein